METEKFLTQIQKALSVIAGIIGLVTIALIGLDIYTIEKISMRILLPILIIGILITFFIVGYFLNKKKTSG